MFSVDSRSKLNICGARQIDSLSRLISKIWGLVCDIIYLLGLWKPFLVDSKKFKENEYWIFRLYKYGFKNL